MKRVIISTDLLSENVNDVYFHYDHKNYDVGDIIYGKNKQIAKDILDAYRQSTGFMDIDSALYVTDKNHSTWDYEYLYEVAPIGDVVSGYSSCSVIICQEDVERLVTTYVSRYNISEEDARNNIILWMSNAYRGDEKCISNLFMYCKYKAKGEIEGICECAGVLNKYII